MRYNPRYKRYQKPLEAAKVCEAAREISEHRYSVISFKNGLLTVSCTSSAAAANLQAESQEIISQINQKVGEKVIKKIRLKIE